MSSIHADPHAEQHPALVHHFEDLDQQKEASSFGMWLFLVTEIMFFTGLIGTYVLLRNGQPNPRTEPWPTPHDAGRSAA